jgi:16S rRNA (cytosine967-C5)-methyltransferase
MNLAMRSEFAPGASALAKAAEALAAVVAESGCTAEEAFRRNPPAAADASAVRAIHGGSLRWYLRLAPCVDSLLKSGQKVSPLVHALLVCAIHQLEYSRAPHAAAVNIAVDAVRVLGQPQAAGFVNALLRRYLRERVEILARMDRSEPAATAHPRWLLRAIHQHYPESEADVLAANNENPAMVLRVNLQRTGRDAMLATLNAAGISAQPGMFETTLVLDQACDVETLPGFSEGLVSVQDAGAQLAAILLDAQPGDRVLDACAAPGGKTGHILEHTAGIAQLVALDISAERLARVESNLARTQSNARFQVADLLDTNWWDGHPFQRILLDAPCSGTGVIRRHPDIKLLRRNDDLPQFAKQQVQLLSRCAELLALGGLLVYATCSILPTENEDVVDRFLLARRDFVRQRADTLLLPSSKSRGPAALTDGFFYACLMHAGARK